MVALNEAKYDVMKCVDDAFSVSVPVLVMIILF